MAQDRSARVMSASALVAAAIALVRSQSVQAGNTVSLDEATKQLIVAIAAATGESLDTVKAILAQIQMSGGTVKGYAPNMPSGITGRVTVSQVGVPYRLPAISIPDDYHILLKAWPANTGIIYVAFTAVGVTNQLEQAYPLIPNEFVGYREQLASAFYVGGNFAGDSVTYTVEQGG